MRGRLFRKAMQAAVNRGWRGFFVLALQGVARRLGLRSAPATPEPQTISTLPADSLHPFDVEYGTDTSGLVWGEDLPSAHRNALWSTAYYGVSPTGFRQVMETLALDWTRFTFVDLGSGKGRALLLASRFPFRRILGVELVLELSAVAAANIARFSADWKRCDRIEARNGDATAFDYPAEPLVIYLYHPFLAPVLKRCLRSLRRSVERHPREVYMVYFNPAFSGVVEKQWPELKLVWERTFSMTKEDAAADRFGSAEEKVVLFRYAP
ncbi:class I SAM-dependent methyltransferase [Granulicella sp. dw_53]|uniref:class I SAM-dependent methyltransferase n=1 Tax=Granulicella sp. dw_53 TaxID=2719792 RepID=UPI001BD5A55E|nr:class I SAM-dependent methyltransferase [Granulicella sp. dw_53]